MVNPDGDQTAFLGDLSTRAALLSVGFTRYVYSTSRLGAPTPPLRPIGETYAMPNTTMEDDKANQWRRYTHTSLRWCAGIHVMPEILFFPKKMLPEAGRHSLPHCLAERRESELGAKIAGTATPQDMTFDQAPAIREVASPSGRIQSACK